MLSKAERAILINQFRVLEAVEGKPGAYEQEITILDRGYEGEYGNLDGFGEALSEERCKFVRKILWLYYLMKLAKWKAAGNPAASSNNGVLDFDPKFPGFDGNKEVELLSYARFITEKRGEFPETKVVNSHGFQPSYVKMLAKWKSWGAPHDLTVQQVAELSGE